MIEHGVLIDSSVWVEYFRRSGSEPAVLVRSALSCGAAHIVPPIRAEIASGARTPREFRRLDDLMRRVIHVPEPPDLWRRIGEARFTLRRQGATVTIIDLWIAAAAESAGLPLVTMDRDFLAIAKAIPVRLMILTA